MNELTPKCAICGQDKMPGVWNDITERFVSWECINPECEVNQARIEHELHPVGTRDRLTVLEAENDRLKQQHEADTITFTSLKDKSGRVARQKAELEMELAALHVLAKLVPLLDDQLLPVETETVRLKNANRDSKIAHNITVGMLRNANAENDRLRKALIALQPTIANAEHVLTVYHCELPPGECYPVVPYGEIGPERFVVRVCNDLYCAIFDIRDVLAPAAPDNISDDERAARLEPATPLGIG